MNRESKVNRATFRATSIWKECVACLSLHKSTSTWPTLVCYIFSCWQYQQTNVTPVLVTFLLVLMDGGQRTTVETEPYVIRALSLFVSWYLRVLFNSIEDFLCAQGWTGAADCLRAHAIGKGDIGHKEIRCVSVRVESNIHTASLVVGCRSRVRLTWLGGFFK